MSRSSYTASERRGILAVAFAALLLIGAGVCFSWCGRSGEALENTPQVEEMTEMIDTVSQRSENYKNPKNKKRTKKSPKGKTKSNKNYRQRSPLDEPV